MEEPLNGTTNAQAEGALHALQEPGTVPDSEGTFASPLSDDALYEGDAGDLPTQVRRAITMLLRYPSISELENGDAYRTTVDQKPLVERALANLGLKLTVNERYAVAYATQANVSGRNPLVTLKANMPISRDVSVLLVSMRVQQHALEARGNQHWFIDREDLESMLSSGPYADDRDGKRVSKSLETAITQLENLGYLKSVDERKERFRIMPILPAVFSIERTYELIATFEGLADNTGTDSESNADDNPRENPVPQ